MTIFCCSCGCHSQALVLVVSEVGAPALPEGIANFSLDSAEGEEDGDVFFVVSTGGMLGDFLEGIGGEEG